MVRVLIVSDSHGLENELSIIKARHKCPYKIHCGDSELEYDAPQMDGFIKVRGNCDYDNRYPNEALVDIEGVKVLICHGHLHQVNSNLADLSYRATELGADIVCYGHTHIALAAQLEDQLILNPGSIKAPRTRVEKTYVVLEWEEKSTIHVQFYLMNGEKFAELSKSVSIG